MKKWIMLLTVAAVMGIAGGALAQIGWAGGVWPNDGHAVTPTGPQDVYIQVWKDGATGPIGPALEINVEMTVINDIGGVFTDNMAYNGPIGDNDEFTAQIPASIMVGASIVTVSFRVYDEADLTFYTGPINDQNNNPSPLTYNVVDVLPEDVAVTFTLCMSGMENIGLPCVIGSAAEIGSWGTGVDMTNVSGDLWEVTVVFLAGGNPNFEYKYKKDNCSNWEGVPNRLVTLPTDGTTSVVLAPDSWDNRPIECGLGSTLEEDKVVCLQVCLGDVETNGGVCSVGNIPELDNWGTGTPAILIAEGLYQTCLVFPAGTPIPLNVEYKFKKDDCQTWEGVGNRLFTVDNNLAYETTLTSTWDDGPSACDPVDTDASTWGGLKSLYR